jgi:uncharacterized protein (DUF58 family)
VLIAVDVSGSMAFGSVDWRKCDIAAELAAMFAFSAVENSDRVRILLFADSIRTFIPPRRGRTHAQVVVRAAVDGDARSARRRGPRSGTPFPRARRGKRAVVLVLSDFLDLAFERPLHRLNRKHDVIAIPIVDPREERFPPADSRDSSTSSRERLASSTSAAPTSHDVRRNAKSSSSVAFAPPRSITSRCRRRYPTNAHCCGSSRTARRCALGVGMSDERGGTNGTNGTYRTNRTNRTYR